MTSILLTGDVMIGRGIDQILRHPSSPELYEPFVRSARDYVALAETKNGPIPRRVSDDYIWGDAFGEMRGADLCIINLETAVTRASKPALKGIHYRCHPDNLGCLKAASVDCCGLANNHVLDWGAEGLIETLDSLDAAGLRHAGAGRGVNAAESPSLLPLPGGRQMLVYARGMLSSGVPQSWAAQADRPGVGYVGSYDKALDRLKARIAAEKRSGDVALVSIHWGGNWGYEVPDADRRFAHRLIDEAGVDIVHGHSSHHPKAIEVHRGRVVLYGCGDFLNDYEGIRGEEEYRPDLVLAYRLAFDAGRLAGLELLPFRIAKFRLKRASREEIGWLAATMDRECRRFGGRVARDGGILRFRALEKVH